MNEPTDNPEPSTITIHLGEQKVRFRLTGAIQLDNSKDGRWEIDAQSDLPPEYIDVAPESKWKPFIRPISSSQPKCHGN